MNNIQLVKTLILLIILLRFELCIFKIIIKINICFIFNLYSRFRISSIANVLVTLEMRLSTISV